MLPIKYLVVVLYCANSVSGWYFYDAQKFCRQLGEMGCIFPPDDQNYCCEPSVCIYPWWEVWGVCGTREEAEFVKKIEKMTNTGDFEDIFDQIPPWVSTVRRGNPRLPSHWSTILRNRARRNSGHG